MAWGLLLLQIPLKGVSVQIIFTFIESTLHNASMKY